MSHFVENGADGAGVEGSTGASDLLCTAGAADSGFALGAVVGGIEVEVDVVGFSGAGDEFDVGKSAVELGDGVIEIGEIAATGGDDVGNLVLIADFGPQVLGVIDA